MFGDFEFIHEIEFVNVVADIFGTDNFLQIFEVYAVQHQYLYNIELVYIFQNVAWNLVIVQLNRLLPLNDIFVYLEIVVKQCGLVGFAKLLSKVILKFTHQIRIRVWHLNQERLQFKRKIVVVQIDVLLFVLHFSVELLELLVFKQLLRVLAVKNVLFEIPTGYNFDIFQFHFFHQEKGRQEHL